ncbi:Type 1 glutamine amidotransferase-like domain-containing protein [Rhodococcus chondri]|uniref:Type 1 glutamine amidotransferase-like domain-containing protein n=1 Tax=Rhodococcus chondri TaxID=3065941 RepID=A0ABU7JV05_9NOCA|nr:Type 1 glutamine amidotransferase-like domain-containing protein [Rhodococcus sp. CC-R104]MEE2033853.1 Type 1 glutamine amidotransferase-like domain-containing protein [Rhodococcus sp. CC-R104]
MRLFLSSYRFGSDPARLLQVTRGPGRIAVIANAVDSWPPRARESAVTSDLGPLRKLGFIPEEVDLRDHIDDPESLRAKLSEYASVWVRGGNTFVLRAQLARSGGDAVLTELVRGDRLAYAGYSAGACVVTPTLRGLEFSDDPAEVAETCGVPVLWDGLGWVDHAIVPHVGTSDLGDDGVARSLRYLERNAVPFVALTDDEALVIDTGEHDPGTAVT